ncbi:2968_t:CDS:2 [Paraglomus occultum]|uniref:2968_t:CDS:1 n=1 Tax=Paraglomus occultum TaxID=144539 RepID=A0A9N8WIR5_9GLOM|nr:2968_t:CDS:2 [Paraglomus occultum]
MSYQLPPIVQEKIIIVMTQSRARREQFRFVSTDSKADIREELEKAFDLDRFSLQDPNGNIITGTFDSLANENSYTIVDRTRIFTPVSASIGQLNAFAETETSSQPVKREIEDEADPQQGKRKPSWMRMFQQKQKRARTSSTTTSAASEFSNPSRSNTSNSANSEQRRVSMTTSPASTFTKIDPQADQASTSIQPQIESSGGGGGGKASSKLSRPQHVCDRCRKSKKKCNRERPCERCTKARVDCTYPEQFS